MAQTYIPLATATPNGATSYTFSGWTGTYTDYVVVGSCYMSGGTTVRLRLNGVTTSSYPYSVAFSDGSNIDVTGSSIELCDVPTGTTSTFVTNIMNADATTLNQKCVLSWGAASNVTNMTGGGLRSTSAISSITILTTNGQTFSSGTKITLFGILRA